MLSSIGRLARRDIDVFLFAECPPDSSHLLNALNEGQSGLYSQVPSKSARVIFYSCIKGANWTDRFFDGLHDRITVQELQTASGKDITLIGAHLDAPNYMSVAGRADAVRQIAADIRQIEKDVRHLRTVLVGDLNMNPFDDGLVSTTAFHAVMTTELAVSVQTYDSRRGYPPFYNPMWSCFGDRLYLRGGLPLHPRRPAGTYFHRNTDDRANFFWNMYDQLLVRPELMDSLVHLEILDTDGSESLVTDGGRPRHAAMTDHLPIFFQLEI